MLPDPFSRAFRGLGHETNCYHGIPTSGCVSLGTPRNLMSFLLSLLIGIHQGGMLSPICSLSDDENIVHVWKDLTRKANCMLHSFSCCSPFVKTKLFSSFCLSLCGSCLWSSSSPALRSLETTFNYYSV